MRSSPQAFPRRTRSWLTFTESRTRIRFAVALIASVLLTGCADIAIIEATPTPAPTLSLPPIGFNHRYGNNPVSSKDGFDTERALFARREFWEVAIRTDPELAGYVTMSDPTAVSAARHAVQTITVLIATEDSKTITGLLAFKDDAGQESYCKWLLDSIRKLGYDAFTKATLQVYFTETDNHATMSWTKAGGYTYQVHDHDLQGTGIRPLPGQTPLPTPAIH